MWLLPLHAHKDGMRYDALARKNKKEGTTMDAIYRLALLRSLLKAGLITRAEYETLAA